MKLFDEELPGVLFRAPTSDVWAVFRSSALAPALLQLKASLFTLQRRRRSAGVLVRSRCRLRCMVMICLQGIEGLCLSAL